MGIALVAALVAIAPYGEHDRPISSATNHLYLQRWCHCDKRQYNFRRGVGG